MLLMTELQLLLAPTADAERRDVSGEEDLDDEKDDGRTVSRDVEASDSELAYRFCSLIRLQQLRTAANQTT